MSDKRTEDKISSIDEVRKGQVLMGMAAELPAALPALPPELEAVVLADVLRVTDGSAAVRVAKAAEMLKLFRAEMAK